MNDVDLNIDNYTYPELLNLFKIDNNYENMEHKTRMDKVLKTIQSSFPNLSLFYFQSSKIISTIFKFFEKDIIKNDKDIDNYLKQIKTIENFQNMNEDDIINKIVEKTIKSYDKNVSNHRLLNEPNINVNNFNPSLNNKNNTNLISNTFTNTVAPGFLNPVKRLTQNQNLNLNSCFRHNYYQTNPSDFLYMIPVEIKNVLSVRLVSIEIPNAWYLFSHIQKNNSFQVQVKVNNEVQVFHIVVPDGNYDIDTLQQFLNATYFYESEMDTYLKYIKFSIDSFNLKTRFEILDNDFTDFQFSLIFVDSLNQNMMTTCGWILGFRLANYLDITEKIQSEGLFDAGGDRYIYIALNDYQYNNNTLNTVCFDKSILNEDVIAKIPMVNGKLSLIVSDDNNPLTKIRRYTGPVNISKLHIKILDKFGAIIDLNKMDYSMTLEMEILYESFNFKNVTS
jgi:hypothetical protein